jgi:ABC-type phosphate transport system substrate-binding protein
MSSVFSMRKTATVLGTATAAMALVVGASAGANAATYVNAGSDTLQNVTRALTTEYTSNVDPNGNNWITVDAGKAAGSVTTGKAACNTNYGTGKNPWPNGSGDGIKALLAERAGTNANCLSFARSSRGPKAGTSEATLTFVKVAGDAITWATKKAGAPTNLTQQQVKDIYNCTITNWNQIPGSTVSGVIQKHIPQAGSGTRQEFIDKVLGGVDPTLPLGGACASTVIQGAQENRGDAPEITSVDAIIPYSKAAYGEQTTPATGVVNHTNGFVLGNINGLAPNATGFVGNRDVFYVYDGTDTESDTDAIAFINWAKAPAQRPIWTSFGFSV